MKSPNTPPMNLLITGASAGFGLETARLFVKNGHRVIGLARRKERLDALKKELGENFYPLVVDITDKAAVKAAIESIPAPFDDIDLLINNAGLALNKEAAFKVDYADWETMIDVNIKGLTYITHLILPKMIAKNDGYIINISSIAANYPYYGSNVYGPTKAFVSHFSFNLRADLIGKNIRVTNVEPGLCSETEFSNVRFKGDDQKAAETYADVEAVTGKDIANTLYWLATQPKHINVNRIEIMPTMQTYGDGLVVYREKKADTN